MTSSSLAPERRTAGSRPPSALRDGRRVRLPARRRRQHLAAGPAVPAPARGVHALSALFDAGRHEWADEQWTGRELAGSVDLRAAHRHLHPRGHAGRGGRQARLPGGARHRLRGAAAGQRASTAPTTGATTACSGTPCTRATADPAAYQRFVDAAHARGLGVIQDVVYNHLGPSGNYLPRVRAVPARRRAQHAGASRSTSTARLGRVRRYILENALMWLRDYHVDGLRLDAVHALQGRARPCTSCRSSPRRPMR